MELECYKIYDGPAPKIIPGRSPRAWMDANPQRHPYRCLPLTMANSTGWEILCPIDVKIIWNGGPGKYDVKLFTSKRVEDLECFADSHFTRGIVTFHTRHLFRTPPGWGIWATGAPNHVKDGIMPLTGLIETDWLPFPFTMNWQMTRPGEVIFEEGEPFCFIMPVEHKKLEQIQPEIKMLRSNPELEQDYHAWTTSRDSFLEKLSKRDKDAIDQGWQRHYMRGEKHDGANIDSHQTKRRLKPVKEN